MDVIGNAAAPAAGPTHIRSAIAGSGDCSSRSTLLPFSRRKLNSRAACRRTRARWLEVRRLGQTTESTA